MNFPSPSPNRAPILDPQNPPSSTSTMATTALISPPPDPEICPPQLIRQDGTFLDRDVNDSQSNLTTAPDQSGRLNCRIKVEDDWATYVHRNFIDLKTKRIKEHQFDVVFVCEDGIEIKGHRVVFGLFSQFFATIFKDQAGTRVTKVILDSVHSEHFIVVRKLAYGQPPNIEIIGKDNLKEIFSLLKSFQLDPDLFLLNGSQISPAYWPKSPSESQPHEAKDSTSTSGPATSTTTRTRQPLNNVNSRAQYRKIRRAAKCNSIPLPINISLPSRPSRMAENIDPNDGNVVDRRTLDWIEQQQQSIPLELECKECNPVKHFDDDEEEEFRWHIARHKGYKLFKCLKCKARFVTEYELKDHEETTVCQPKSPKHAPPPAKRANIGGGRHINSPRALNTSAPRRKVPAATARNQKKSTDLMYICKWCQHRSDNLETAMAHGRTCARRKRNVPDEESFTREVPGFYGNMVCPVRRCPRRYLTMHGFVLHKAKAHPELPGYKYNMKEAKLQCETCQHSFTRPIDFYDHLNSNQECPHTRISPLRLAGSPTRHRSTLNQSLPSSYSVSQVPGPGIRASFRANQAVPGPSGVQPKNPIRHATDTPGLCPFCNKNKDEIVDHINDVHWARNVKIIYKNENKFECTKCNIELVLSDLISHLGSCASTTRLPKVELGQAKIDEMEYIAYLTDPDLLIRELSCGYCNTTYEKYRKAHDCLLKHRITRCSLCFNAYTCPLEYKQHLQACHTTEEKKIRCPICSDLLGNFAGACQHVYRKHWVPILRDIIPENEWTQSMVGSRRSRRSEQ